MVKKKKLKTLNGINIVSKQRIDIEPKVNVKNYRIRSVYLNFKNSPFLRQKMDRQKTEYHGSCHDIVGCESLVMDT